MTRSSRGFSVVGRSGQHRGPAAIVAALALAATLALVCRAVARIASTPDRLPAPAAGHSQCARTGTQVPSEGPNALLTGRIVAISARYRGTPYRRDPLGEGPAGSVDRDPLICTTCVDCQTYVEQVLAEALAGRPDQVLPLLTRIRYCGGVVGFGTRNHFMVADWLPHNRWLIRDRTEAVGGRHVRWMEKVIDRAAFFRARGAPAVGRGMVLERVRTPFIPRSAIPVVAAQVPDGAVLIWVQNRPGIIAAHCGFAIRGARGELLFRHASELRGRVLDEPMHDFLRHAPARIVGVKVCQAVAPAFPLLDRRHRRR